jgi:hypothetical protein
MPSPSLADLLIQEDQETILATELAIAQSLNLPVTAWLPGDPTRSLLIIESIFLEKLEAIVVGFIQSGFLTYAQGEWLTILAKQLYNVDVAPASYAETDVTLTNSGGGVYTLGPGDLTLKNSTTGATYHNITGGTLTGSGGMLSVTVVADIAGSTGSAGATQIDTLVTGLLGVTCSNPAAAVGLDVAPPTAIIQQCINKLASLSPNGPAAAYEFVALSSGLTGVVDVTRARAYGDSETGDVALYIANDSGAVSGGDVTAVQAAVLKWATPLCITPTTASASNVVVPVTYTIWLYTSVNQNTLQISTAIADALETFFAARPIGGDIIPPATTGSLSCKMIESIIGRVFPNDTFKVLLASPSADTALANGQVAVLGTIIPSINLYLVHEHPWFTRPLLPHHAEVDGASLAHAKRRKRARWLRRRRHERRLYRASSSRRLRTAAAVGSDRYARARRRARGDGSRSPYSPRHRRDIPGIRRATAPLA